MLRPGRLSGDHILSSAMKIHISHPTKTLLEMIGGYETELRGEMEIKVYALFCGE